MSDEGYVAVSGLRKAFGRTPVLDGVDVAMRRGELVALLGPSGCGKTTVLRIVAGLLAADEGTVAIDGRSLAGLPPHRRDIGVVFQSYALFPHMSVRANVRFGLEMRGVGRAEAERRVDAALALVQLSQLGGRRPSELSGGQQQRVALARAVVIQPRLLLLDEPLSNLDAMLRATMRVDIRDLHLRTGLTTILVTHDQTEAMTMADRIAVMAHGRVQQVGTPEQVYEDPATAFVASFVGHPPATLLRVNASGGVCRVGDVEWQPPAATLAAIQAAPGSEALLCLRPERLRITGSRSPRALSGRVVAVEFLGADRLVHVQVGGARVVVRTGGQESLSTGEVGVEVTGSPPLFDTAGGERIRGRHAAAGC